MKYASHLILTFFFFNTFAQNPANKNDINVLFIGNSLTYFYGMPTTVQKMLNETETNYKIDQITFPGMSLNNHLNSIIYSKSENTVNTREKKNRRVNGN